MGDENHIRTLGDYSKPSHEGYRNTIKLPVRNNVVPLRSDTIRLVQNGCSFYGLWSEDPNQHLKYFLKLVDSLDLNGESRERTRLRLFHFPLRDQASNWLERLPTRSITTWEDLTTRFLTQFFPPGRTAKLRNDILMFQQHHGESLSEAWTHFKDLLQKVSHLGIDLWLKYCMKDSEQAFIEYASSRTDEAGEEDGDMMFIEIVLKDDNSCKEEPEVGEQEVEYFDIFLTRSELAYHKYLMYGPILSIFLQNQSFWKDALQTLRYHATLGMCM
uniref:Zinc finger, CCHC-type n=1 Tax=Tanacetum cinerariifolium TaxID=118510 RepID=A0A699HHU7_TANCI|nr:zinc finger, CCHC-type [Tanacetum cinerariifolium]